MTINYQQKLLYMKLQTSLPVEYTFHPFLLFSLVSIGSVFIVEAKKLGIKEEVKNANTTSVVVRSMFAS